MTQNKSLALAPGTISVNQGKTVLQGILKSIQVRSYHHWDRDRWLCRATNSSPAIASTAWMESPPLGWSPRKWPRCWTTWTGTHCLKSSILFPTTVKWITIYSKRLLIQCSGCSISKFFMRHLQSNRSDGGECGRLAGDHVEGRKHSRTSVVEQTSCDHTDQTQRTGPQVVVM